MSIQSVGSQMDVQRAKAEKFVNASDRTINRLASRNYNKLYKEEDKNFNKRVVTTLNTLPAVAVVSGLAAGKGKKGALLSGLGWSFALIAPALVGAANKSLVKNNPKLEKAERKHPLTALAGSVAASVAGYMGLASIADKVLANPKVATVGKNIAGKANNVLNAAKTAAFGFIKKTKIREAVVATAMSIPKPIVDGAAKIAKNPVVKNVGSFVKNAGKSVASNAPMILTLATLGAVVGKAFSDASKFTAIKKDIKDAQFNTAKNLVNAYSAENKELKAENAKLAQADSAQADVEDAE